MNDYILSMQFAECLMKSVVKKQQLDGWKLTDYMLIGNQQNTMALSIDSVGKSVAHLMLLRYDIIYRCYYELSFDSYSAAELGHFVIESVPHYFPSGYSHCGFIAFCGMTIGVAIYFLQIDDINLANYMIGIVGNVLSAFMLTGEFWNQGGWDGLEDVSMDFNAGAKKKLKNMSPEDRKEHCRFVFQKEINLDDTDDSS